MSLRIDKFIIKWFKLNIFLAFVVETFCVGFVGLIYATLILLLTDNKKMFGGTIFE